MSTSRRYGKKADIALRMWVKLVRAFATLNRLSAEDIRSYGVTQAQFGVLEVLGHLGPMSLGELARKMLVSCGNTTVIVDNLEKEEFLERTQHPEDRRVKVVQLTPKGRKFFLEIFPKHAAAMAEFVAVLEEQDQERLGALLKKLGLALTQRFG
jgi:MarR family transcriptional regulator, 2-MHQ and catechol-resistance regulon repressor